MIKFCNVLLSIPDEVQTGKGLFINVLNRNR